MVVSKWSTPTSEFCLCHPLTHSLSTPTIIGIQDNACLIDSSNYEKAKGKWANANNYIVLIGRQESFDKE